MVKMSEKEIIERMNKEIYIFISLFKYYSKQLGNIQYLFEVRGALACVFDNFFFFLGCRNFGL